MSTNASAHVTSSSLEARIVPVETETRDTFKMFEPWLMRLSCTGLLCALCLPGACSIDDRSLSASGGSAGQGMRDAGGSVSGQSGAAPIASAGAADAGEGGQGGAAPAFVDGCADLDNDSVSDCSETAVENSAFDADVASWQAEPGAALAWNAQDLLGQPNSGSALVTSSGAIDAGGDSFVAVDQCVSVREGQIVDILADAYIDPGQAAGRAAISLWFFPMAGCPGESSSDAFETADVFAVDKLSTLHGTKAVPSGMLSVRVRLGAIKPFQAQIFSVHFDNVLIHVH
jgi:hypothetical protein